MRLTFSMNIPRAFNTFSIINASHPSSWDSCTQQEIVDFIKLKDTPDTLSMRILLLQKWLNIPKKFFVKMSNEQISECLVLNEWILEQDSLDKWIFDEIEVSGIRYYGPNDKLKNITIGEFAMVDMSFVAYTLTKDKKHLWTMIACLMRPKKKRFNPLASDFDRDI